MFYVINSSFKTLHLKSNYWWTAKSNCELASTSIYNLVSNNNNNNNSEVLLVAIIHRPDAPK